MPSASQSGSISETSGSPLPHSHFDTVLSLMPSPSASCRCVRPPVFLHCAINLPMRIWSMFPTPFAAMVHPKPPQSHPRCVEFHKFREAQSLSFRDSCAWPVKHGIVCLGLDVGMIEAETGFLSAFLCYGSERTKASIPGVSPFRKGSGRFGLVQEKRR